jgi:hypothetical protein
MIEGARRLPGLRPCAHTVVDTLTAQSYYLAMRFLTDADLAVRPDSERQTGRAEIPRPDVQSPRPFGAGPPQARASPLRVGQRWFGAEGRGRRTLARGAAAPRSLLPCLARDFGNLPWGYLRDPDSGIAVPDPERAPLVGELFERYATGQESDRSMAAWLNAKGARTARGRAFGKDTVRDMLLNSAYCGYVGGLRSKDRSIRGLHEPLVPEGLFDRVQEVRSWRTRVVKPGRPSEDYLLRKLLYCERCGARMHGNRGSTGKIRRYHCSTRRHGDGCDQPLAHASRLRRSSSTGCAASSRTPSCGPSSWPRCARRPHSRTAAPPGGGIWTANSSDCGTST